MKKLILMLLLAVFYTATSWSMTNNTTNNVNENSAAVNLVFIQDSSPPIMFTFNIGVNVTEGLPQMAMIEGKEMPREVIYDTSPPISNNNTNIIAKKTYAKKTVTQSAVPVLSQNRGQGFANYENNATETTETKLTAVAVVEIRPPTMTWTSNYNDNATSWNAANKQEGSKLKFG